MNRAVLIFFSLLFSTKGFTFPKFTSKYVFTPNSYPDDEYFELMAAAHKPINSADYTKCECDECDECKIIVNKTIVNKTQLYDECSLNAHDGCEGLFY